MPACRTCCRAAVLRATHPHPVRASPGGWRGHARARHRACGASRPAGARPTRGAGRACSRESFAGQSSWCVAEELPTRAAHVGGGDGFEIESRTHCAADGIAFDDAVGLHLVDRGDGFSDIQRGIYQAASTELSSSALCGNTAANRMPTPLENKGRMAEVGQDGGLLLAERCILSPMVRAIETLPAHGGRICER